MCSRWVGGTEVLEKGRALCAVASSEIAQRGFCRPSCSVCGEGECRPHALKLARPRHENASQNEVRWRVPLCRRCFDQAETLAPIQAILWMQANGVDALKLAIQLRESLSRERFNRGWQSRQRSNYAPDNDHDIATTQA